MDLKNKVAVVTGGAQGLGRAFVEVLLKQGSNVISLLVCLHVYKYQSTSFSDILVLRILHHSTLNYRFILITGGLH